MDRPGAREGGVPDVPFLARTKSFTRRSRDLNPAQERTYRRFKDEVEIEVPRDVGFTTVDPNFRLDPHALFGRAAPLVVEVGSGRGEQMLADAAAHPERDYLAFEVWRPGLARLVGKAGEQGLTNIRVIEADAQLALKTLLPEGSVSELWTFFPDPWRKSRHHKRRLVSDDFAATASRLLEEGGIWRMATDWEDYAGHMLRVAGRAGDLENPFEDPDWVAPEPGNEVPEPSTGGFAPRWSGRVQTHFEERGAKEGRPAWDLTLVRMPWGPESPSEAGPQGGAR